MDPEISVRTHFDDNGSPKTTLDLDTNGQYNASSEIDRQKSHAPIHVARESPAGDGATMAVTL